jgi:hypothetical protein
MHGPLGGNTTIEEHTGPNMHGRYHSWRRCFRWAPAVLLVAGACGTEPNPDVGGTWSLTSTSAGGDLVCTVEALLTITSGGANLTGTLVQEQVACTSAGEPSEAVAQSYGIIGTLEGDDISFSTQEREGHGGCAFTVFEGRAADSTMSGRLETRPVFCQGTFVQMRGTWQAQRR